MSDVFTKAKRSVVMSQIRSTGNRDTELALIRIFRANKITGWRRGWPLDGRPDFVFPKDRLAIFVDGCFWHGCQAHSRTPRSNVAYWKDKLARNRQRDRFVVRVLRDRGWRVVRLWEHDLTPKRRQYCLKRIARYLN